MANIKNLRNLTLFDSFLKFTLFGEIKIMSLIYNEWTKWTCRCGAQTKQFIRLSLQNPSEETLQGLSYVIRTQIVLRWLFSGTRKACPITSNLFLAVHDTASPVSSKEKVHSVVYALWDHFPRRVLIFFHLIKLLKRIHWGPCQASLLYPPSSPLSPPPWWQYTEAASWGLFG